jgi:lysozyme
MSPEQRLKLVASLTRHEGRRHYPYQDIAGKSSIGVGRNLSDVGLSDEEINLLLDHDIDRAEALASTFPWFATLDDVRQRVVLELAFNLGHRLHDFTHLLASIAVGDYATAARELQNSRWFTQVGQRGPRLVQMLATGEDARPSDD